MSDRPLVSIVIPVYNGEDYVREAIDSALAQTYENTEIIVVNDGSCDNGATRNIALSYGDKIRYYEKENGGVSSALNFGIAKMRGEYFSWLSHDDVYYPQKVEKQVELMEGKTSCVAFCICDTINSKSELMRTGTLRKLLKPNEINPPGTALREMFHSSSYGGCNFLIPVSAFRDCGVFDEELRYVQDTLMWIRLFLNGYSLLYVNNHGVKSRVHEGQLTQRGRALFEKESVVLCQKVLPEMVAFDNRDENILFSFAMNNARYHNKEAVKMCIAAAKEKNLITTSQLIKLRAMTVYGAVRPGIRKVYYKLVRGMNTK